TQLYEGGNCKELIHQLNNLSKPKSWNNNILWSGSRILKAKCHREIGNFKLALKSLKQTPESEFRDAWIFQNILVLLKSDRHREAIVSIRKLLKLPENNYYLDPLRKYIKSEFNTDKETSQIFNLLHDTRKNY
ncbi:MAG TPA: hypothetical protein DCG23_05655, partial [Deltaproteobacteria bacterium]|nr:hypothetical protein [Deltaproteobacteria bacterium]